MKNRFLLAIIILLIVLIYVLDELPQRKREEKKQLFNPSTMGELISIQTPAAYIKKEDGLFKTKDGHPVDPARMDHFFSILSSIRIKRILPSKEQSIDYRHFFPNPENRFIFTFDKERLVFLLGEKIKTNESFYMELKKNSDTTWLIAHDSSSMEGLYLKESNSSRKYDRLKSLLTLDNDFFRDRHILKDQDLSKLLNVLISNKRNRSFRLDFSPHGTHPSPYPSISLDSSSFVRFKMSLKNLQSRRIYSSYRKSLLKNRLSRIDLNTGDKKHILELFGHYGSLKGYFLMSGMNLYELDQKNTSIFFLNRQDFWNRRPLPISFGGKDEIFTMVFKDTQFKLKLPLRDDIQSLDGKEPSKKEFDNLFSLLIRKADYLSIMKDNHKYKKAFLLDFDDFSIHVILKNRELIVKRQDILYHYGVDEEIPFNKEDYFAGSLL